MDDALSISPGMTETQKSFTRTINEYSKRLLGFIRKRVKNDADAEDILQDVFYQFIGNTQPIEQLAAWFFTVARNKIIDRKRKMRPEFLEEIYSSSENDYPFDWSELFFDNADNPETEYLRNLFWEELNAALNDLPAEQREVFVLHELEGLSFKTIALQTGEMVNTLISRKRYAVLHLRERLQLLRDELLNY